MFGVGFLKGFEPLGFLGPTFEPWALTPLESHFVYTYNI